MSMKIKPEAVASIRKMAAVCQGKHLSTKQDWIASCRDI